jgi:uncharacterized protein YndB with AHSA1/START domain
MSGTQEPKVGREPNRPLTTVERVVHAEPDRVFDVLTDAWLLPVWVVGATHIRDVDQTWPAPRSKVHHQVGPWPISISDSTAVVECDPPRQLILQGRAWPLGEVRIELTVERHDDGTLVRMAEAPSYGTARVLDNPLQRRLLAARNRECLARLAAIVENRRALSTPAELPERPLRQPEAQR